MSKKICIFGDSIAQGYFDDEAGGWAERLSQDLVNYGGDYYGVFNLGISGNLTSDVLERCENEVRVRNPEIVIFAIGINDAAFDMPQNKNRINIEKCARNIEQMIEVMQSLSCRVGFVGLTRAVEEKTTPVAWNNKNLHYLNTDIKKYDQKIAAVAKKNDVPYCHIFDVLNDEDLPDGLHPNAEGHEKIFQKVKEFLVKNKIIKL